MKDITKLLLVLALLANTVLLVSCGDEANIISSEVDQVTNTNFTARTNFSFSRNVPNHANFRLIALNGSIDIIEVAGLDSIRISGEKIVGSESTSDAVAHLRELEVVVWDSAGELFVKTTQPLQSGGRSYVVNYSITLPENMDVVVNSVNGSISLDEIVGNVSVDLVNGEIDGKVILPVDGSINMNIINGNMALDVPQNTSAQFAATVVNGSIVISGLSLQNRAETSRSLRGTLGNGQGTITMSTTNGGIKVRGF